ncbi:class E sortase [Streptomyces sp. NPDC085946]|uniref:class E sortase n=1 Tax=Streptomyces sp. NPDC085946 TaxID=3365744 RepID=UPI0037D54697
MTALRPERESGTSYGQQEPYGGPGTFEDWSAQAPGTGAYGAVPGGPDQGPYEGAPAGPYPAAPHDTSAYGPGTAGYGTAAHETVPHQAARYEGAAGTAPSAGYEPPVDDETVALRIPDPPPGADDAVTAPAAPGASRAARSPAPAPGGRAARRKAAKRRQGRHGGPRPALEEADAPRAPLSRVEARRQARARRPGPAVVASRVIGELFITTGVLMLLFVSYQLWWTNVRAHAQADKATSSLQDDWASGRRAPGAFEPGQGFAILHIPKLDVVVPIAEGTSSKKVLDRGMVGHYADGALKTAMPDAETGNFGLAGHRNTHGEPFRYINRLQPGDPIVVETQDTYYVYTMASILPVTPPSNVRVLDPVPAGSGFTEAGRYITLTTCTPEFTSKYRMIVWGKMVEERPRSKGKPDALVS